jgi:hypothetical protein
MQNFTAMTVRSCTFSLLAMLCSVTYLFETERQTALIQVLTCIVLLLQNANLQRWNADVPDRIDAIYAKLKELWPASVGKWTTLDRVIVHLTSHWRQQYTELGTPVNWTTKDFIEALQKVVKAAYRCTNLVGYELQIMRQLSLDKYIDTVVSPSLAKPDDADADRRVAPALQRDRATQAYLRGATVKAVPGVNTLFPAPRCPAEFAWNADVDTAMRKCARLLENPRLPPNHCILSPRIIPRNACFVCRKGKVAHSVSAHPEQCVRDVKGATAEHAIFSVFEEVGVAANAGGGAAAAAAAPAVRVAESKTGRFIVDAWFSYDVRGLSSVNPNAPPPAKRPTAKELDEDCIDLCFCRWLSVQPSVTGSGIAARDEADAVLQRLKRAPGAGGKLAILEVGTLCQPLWAFPWLGNYESARAQAAFSRSSFSKWDAEQWLVAKKLY